MMIGRGRVLDQAVNKLSMNKDNLMDKRYWCKDELTFILFKNTLQQVIDDIEENCSQEYNLWDGLL